MKTKLNVVFVYLFLGTSVLHGQAMSFEDLWNKIKTSSPELRAIQSEQTALQIQGNTSTKYFYPKLYLQGKSFVSNDPTTKFMGLMNQRDINGADFAPAKLTNHDYEPLHLLALGVNLPIYEGGVGKAKTEVFKQSIEVKNYESESIKNSLYSQTATSYGSLLVSTAHEKKITSLKKEISTLIQKYQLGNKNNPIGYAGQLALKNLEQNLAIISTQIDSQKKVQYLTLMTLLQQQTSPNLDLKLEPGAFVDHHLVVNLPSQDPPKPPQAIALEKAAAVRLVQTQAELGQYQPQISAFAESSLTSGARNPGVSTLLGIALNWSLYDATEKNISAISNAEANTLKYKAKILEKDTLVAAKNYREQKAALEQTALLLETSSNLLDEQLVVVLKLFHSGVVNVLPVVEIMGRKVELAGKSLINDLELMRTRGALWLSLAHNTKGI